MRNRVFLTLVVLTVVLATALPISAAALGPGGTFRDDDGNVHEGGIEAIAAAGITKGCNPPLNDRYCPANSITRGQMAAFLVRALDLPPAAADKFTDDVTSVFEDDINRLAAAGITKGCNPPVNDQYCPTAVVTREQMAAFLVRSYGYSDAGGGDRFGDDDGDGINNASDDDYSGPLWSTASGSMSASSSDGDITVTFGSCTGRPPCGFDEPCN